MKQTYIYGETITSVIYIEAESDNEALRLLSEQQAGGFKHEDVKQENFKIEWGETPENNSIEIRDGVLAEFLKMMTRAIQFPKRGKIELLSYPFGGKAYPGG